MNLILDPGPLLNPVSAATTIIAQLHFKRQSETPGMLVVDFVQNCYDLLKP